MVKKSSPIDKKKTQKCVLMIIIIKLNVKKKISLMLNEDL